MNELKKHLKREIDKQNIDGYFGTPQYEAYGDTYAIVGYDYSPGEENEIYEKQKEKIIEELENNDFLEWDFVNKYYDRLMENDRLMDRIKRIFIKLLTN